MRLFIWILKFYPRAWRTRYEAEMLALLEEHHITFLTVFDLLFGAFDAHLDPYYRSERMLFSFKSVRYCRADLHYSPCGCHFLHVYLVYANNYVSSPGRCNGNYLSFNSWT